MTSFVLSAFTPVPNWVAGRVIPEARLEHADAIVVLATGVETGGSLSDRSLRRVVRGVSLYLQGLAPLLVLSGPGRRGGPTEVSVAADLADRFGVPKAAIVGEERVRTTREEALRIGSFLRQRNLRRVLLVTDSPHLMRAADLFAAAGLVVLPAPADDIPRSASYPAARLSLARDLAREGLALLYYRAAGFLPVLHR